MRKKVNISHQNPDPLQIGQLSLFLEKEQQRYEDILASNCILKQGRSLLQHNSFKRFFGKQNEIRYMLKIDTFNAIRQERFIYHNLRIQFCQPIINAWKNSTRNVLLAIKHANAKLLSKSYRSWNTENILYIPNYENFYKPKIQKFQQIIYKEVLQGFIQFIKLRLLFLKGLYAGYNWRSVFKSLEQQFKVLPPFQRFKTWYINTQEKSKLILKRSQIIMNVNPVFISWFQLTWQKFRPNILLKLANKNALQLHGQYLHAWIIYHKMRKIYLQKYTNIWKNFIGIQVELEVQKCYLNKFEIRHTIQNAFSRWKKYIFVQDIVLKSKYLKSIYGECSILNQQVLDIQIHHPRANIAIAFVGFYSEKYKPFSTAIKCLFSWKQLPKQKKAFNRFCLLLYGVFNLFRSRSLLRYWIYQHRTDEEVNFYEMEAILFQEFMSIDLLKSLINIVRCSPGHALMQLRNNEKIEMENLALIHKYKRLILTLTDEEVNESVTAIFQKKNISSFVIFFWRVTFRLLVNSDKINDKIIKVSNFKINEDKQNENFKTQAKQQEKNMSRRYANFLGEVENQFQNKFSKEQQYHSDLLKLFQKNKQLTEFIQKNPDNSFHILSQSLLTNNNNFLLTSDTQLQSTTYKIGQHFEGYQNNIIIPQAMFSKFQIYNTHGVNFLENKQLSRVKDTKRAIQSEKFRNKFPPYPIFKLSDDITNWLIGCLAYCNNKEYITIYQTRNLMLKTMYKNIQKHYQEQQCTLTWLQLGQDNESDEDIQIISQQQVEQQEIITNQYVQEAIDYDYSREDKLVQQMIQKNQINNNEIGFGPMLSRQTNERIPIKSNKLKDISTNKEVQELQSKQKGKRQSNTLTDKEKQIKDKLQASGCSLDELKNIMKQLKGTNNKDQIANLMSKFQNKDTIQIDIDEDFLREIYEAQSQNDNIDNSILETKKINNKNSNNSSSINKVKDKVKPAHPDKQKGQFTKKQIDLVIEDQQQNNIMSKNTSARKSDGNQIQKLPQILSNELEEEKQLQENYQDKQNNSPQKQNNVTQKEQRKDQKNQVKSQQQDDKKQKQAQKQQSSTNQDTINRFNEKYNDNQKKIQQKNNNMEQKNNYKAYSYSDQVQTTLAQQVQKITNDLVKKLQDEEAQLIQKSNSQSNIQQLINLGFTLQQAQELANKGILSSDIEKLFQNGINPQQSQECMETALNWKNTIQQQNLLKVNQQIDEISKISDSKFSQEQINEILVKNKIDSQIKYDKNLSEIGNFDIQTNESMLGDSEHYLVESDKQKPQNTSNINGENSGYQHLQVKNTQNNLNSICAEELGPKINFSNGKTDNKNIINQEYEGNKFSDLNISQEDELQKQITQNIVKEIMSQLDFDPDIINQLISCQNDEQLEQQIENMLNNSKIEISPKQAEFLYEYAIQNKLHCANIYKQISEIIAKQPIYQKVINNGINFLQLQDLFIREQPLLYIENLVSDQQKLEALIIQQNKEIYSNSINQFKFNTFESEHFEKKMNMKTNTYLKIIEDRLVNQVVPLDLKSRQSARPQLKLSSSKQKMAYIKKNNSNIVEETIQDIIFQGQEDTIENKQFHIYSIKDYDKRGRKIISAPLIYFNRQYLIQGVLLRPFSVQTYKQKSKPGQKSQPHTSQMRRLNIKEHSSSFIKTDISPQECKPRDKLRNTIDYQNMNSNYNILTNRNYKEDKKQYVKNVNIKLNMKDQASDLSQSNLISGEDMQSSVEFKSKNKVVKDFDKLFSKIGVSKLQDIVAQRHNQLVQALKNENQEDDFTKKLAQLAKQKQDSKSSVVKREDSDSDLIDQKNVVSLQLSTLQNLHQNAYIDSQNNYLDSQEIVAPKKDDLYATLHKRKAQQNQVILSKDYLKQSQQNLLPQQQQSQQIRVTANMASQSQCLAFSGVPDKFRPLMTIQSGTADNKNSYNARIIGPQPQSVSSVKVDDIFLKRQILKQQQIDRFKAEKLIQ